MFNKMDVISKTNFILKKEYGVTYDFVTDIEFTSHEYGFVIMSDDSTFKINTEHMNPDFIAKTIYDSNRYLINHTNHMFVLDINEALDDSNLIECIIDISHGDNAQYKVFMQNGDEFIIPWTHGVIPNKTDFKNIVNNFTLS